MTCDHNMMQTCPTCRPAQTVIQRRDSEAATFRLVNVLDIVGDAPTDSTLRRPAIAVVAEPAPVRFERPAIERYVRCSVPIPEGSVEVGVQYNERPDVDRKTIRQVVVAAYFRLRTITPSVDGVEHGADAITSLIEDSMTSMWPDRAWFVEVWSGTGDNAEPLTQVYQPYGMPRTIR